MSESVNKPLSPEDIWGLSESALPVKDPAYCRKVLRIAEPGSEEYDEALKSLQGETE